MQGISNAAALRALPAGAALALAELDPLVKQGFGADDLPWLQDLVQGLERDGLAVIEGGAARLP
jgi:hypothetical protein